MKDELISEEYLQESEYKSYGDYIILDQKNLQSIIVDEDVDDQFYFSTYSELV